MTITITNNNISPPKIFAEFITDPAHPQIFFRDKFFANEMGLVGFSPLEHGRCIKLPKEPSTPDAKLEFIRLFCSSYFPNKLEPHNYSMNCVERSPPSLESKSVVVCKRSPGRSPRSLVRQMR